MALDLYSVQETIEQQSRAETALKFHNELNTKIQECKCGHAPNVPVTQLMERYGKEITVKEVMNKARCSNCGQKNNFEFRIIYIGGSYDAMLGGTTKPKKPDLI